MQFFHSLAFGIIAMILVGTSWCLTGYVMGDAPKREVPSSSVQRMGAVFSLLIGLCIISVTRSWPQGIPGTFLFWASMAYLFTGVLNCWMLQFMSMAMQRGPNGVIWCIIQSACVFQFLGSIVCGNVTLTLPRFFGLLSIICALVLFAVIREKSLVNQNVNKMSWKALAFLALALAATQQNITVIPSYYEELRPISAIYRVMLVAIGTIGGMFFWSLVKKEGNPFFFSKKVLKNKYFWYYCIAMQAFSLIFSYLFFYPGIDIMSAAGLGGMCYPVMVGSCIIAFTATSVFILKERLRWIQVIALFFCIAGMVCLCIK